MKPTLLLLLASSLLTMTVSAETSPLDGLLEPIAPEIKKWASIGILPKCSDSPEPTWFHYQNSRDAVDFWPASTIKTYAAIAALETLNELHFPSDTAIVFESYRNERWRLDSARTMKEMISEVFRRSSNEDYTLLLRFVGIDRINTRFLIPEKGFPHSALMRDYITWRPPLYENEEPQRITLLSQGGQTHQFTHQWSGISYSEPRGATALSATTGNCTSTYELAECIRRIVFHDSIPPAQRYNITSEQARLIRDGSEVEGLYGLRDQTAGGFSWKDALGEVFPKAKFYHKVGYISAYSVDQIYLEDPETGTRFVLALAANTGETTVITQMAKAIGSWARTR